MRLIQLLLLISIIAPAANATPYKISMKMAPMHESFIAGEDKESKLVVEKDGHTQTYSFMMGCGLMEDHSQYGLALLNCPKEFSGVFTTNEILRIDLSNGKPTMLLDQIVYIFQQELAKAYVGVRQLKPLRYEGKNPRELFVLSLDEKTLSKNYKAVTQGSWLPSSNDLELEGGPEGWDKLEKKWSKLIQIKGDTLSYRADPKQTFKTFRLKEPNG